MCLIAVSEMQEWSRSRFRQVYSRSSVVHGDQFIRSRERQWFQNNSVHDAEDCTVRANTYGESNNRCDGKNRRADESTKDESHRYGGYTQEIEKRRACRWSDSAE